MISHMSNVIFFKHTKKKFHPFLDNSKSPYEYCLTKLIMINLIIINSYSKKKSIDIFVIELISNKELILVLKFTQMGPTLISPITF